MSGVFSRSSDAFLSMCRHPLGQCSAIAVLVFWNNYTWNDYHPHATFRSGVDAMASLNDQLNPGGVLDKLCTLEVALSLLGGLLYAATQKRIGERKSHAYYLSVVPLALFTALAMVALHLELFAFSYEDQAKSPFGLWLEGRLGILPLIIAAFWGFGLATYCWYKVP